MDCGVGLVGGQTDECKDRQVDVDGWTDGRVGGCGLTDGWTEEWIGWTGG